MAAVVWHVESSLPSSDRQTAYRCPSCGNRVTALPVDKDQHFITKEGETLGLGQRLCPTNGCAAHVFVVYANATGTTIATYPAQTLDFDGTAIPEAVAEALNEAIKCHANQCLVAAAIMVRKTLEEVCRERGAEGLNLKQRIEALGAEVVLPKAMLDGLDELRVLGNDAAHVESSVFDEIGQAEVEIAIDVAKEILNATYRYESIMGRLQTLKRNM